MDTPCYKILFGKNRKTIKTIGSGSIDAIVTDSPYGIGFMNKKWDYEIPGVGIWKECLRVLKPGGYLLSFASPRTYHRIAVNIEDAGFEIRDQIMWIYGQGFPKSMDIAKAIDKAVGAKREVIGRREHPTLKDKSKVERNGKQHFHGENAIADEWDITAPATEEAKKWDGWGTALKPAHEPIVVARKPFEGTLVKNISEYGTGAINIAASRVEFADAKDLESATFGTGRDIRGGNYGSGQGKQDGRTNIPGNPEGRFPANVIHDGSDEVLEHFPHAKGQQGYVGPLHGEKKSVNTYGDYGPRRDFFPRNDSGSAARFFYCAKASKGDRNEGLPDYLVNDHETVKPTALMRYLCKLVTPPGGIILDPFAGSGSTGKAAALEGFSSVLLERQKNKIPIIDYRVKWAVNQYLEKIKPTGQTNLFE
jgi:DNA modification methylase